MFMNHEQAKYQHVYHTYILYLVQHFLSIIDAIFFSQCFMFLYKQNLILYRYIILSTSITNIVPQ